MTEHTITAVGAVLDCADPERLADFWQAAIGFTSRTGDGQPYVTLAASDLRRPLNHLTLQRVPEAKTVKNRLHLDLFAGDLLAEVARLQGLGATELGRVPEGAADADVLYITLADPEGNELCVLPRPTKPSAAPPH